MAKKTISIEALKNKVNEKNKVSTCSPDVRNGWNDLLESTLHGTESYKGFRYLTSKEVPDDALPGINVNLGLMHEMNTGDSGVFKNTDDSRKFYY